MAGLVLVLRQYLIRSVQPVYNNGATELIHGILLTIRGKNKNKKDLGWVLSLGIVCTSHVDYLGSQLLTGHPASLPTQAFTAQE